MTKEEILKEAFNYGYNSFHECNTKQDYEHHLKDCIESFIDTEDNNGWIKIQSEEDLPKENGIYWTLRKKSIVPLYKEIFYDLDKDYWLNNYTYYQSIEKPKPPIY